MLKQSCWSPFCSGAPTKHTGERRYESVRRFCRDAPLPQKDKGKVALSNMPAQLVFLAGPCFASCQNTQLLRWAQQGLAGHRTLELVYGEG